MCVCAAADGLVYRELWVLVIQMKFEDGSSVYSHELDTSTHRGCMCTEHVQSWVREATQTTNPVHQQHGQKQKKKKKTYRNIQICQPFITEKLFRFYQ